MHMARESRQFLLLILIMMAVAACVSGVTYFILYKAAFDGQRERLRETAQSRASLIESVARFDMEFSENDAPGGAFEATMSQIVKAHDEFQGFGKTGEFTLGQRTGDKIVFLLSHRHGKDAENPKPIDIKSELAEPMRLALCGKSGTLIGLDYRGVLVLAAHEPVGVYGLGIVAKIDVAEVREPFIKAALLALAFLFVFGLLGAFIFLRVANPIVKRLRENTRRIEREMERRAQASLALDEEKKRLESLMNNLQGMVYRCRNEPDWPMEFVSRSGVELLGYTPEELTDGSVIYGDLIHESDKERVWDIVQEAIENDVPYKMEFRLHDRTGNEKWVWEQGEKRYLEAENRFVLEGIVTDITEQKNLENQIMQSHKMEAVGRLAGGIAHDFNNLLTGISGNVSLAMMDVSPQDPFYESLLEINEAARRAGDLTRQLLAFSRKQLISPKVIGPNQLLSNLEKMLGRLIGEDIDLVWKMAENICNVKVDPGQIEQVVINLAVNARDAMPDGGKLTIETANVELDEEYVAHHSQIESGSYVMIAVSDDGAGMDEETKSKIFEPFFTTKKEGKGTGLGLATTFGIVKQHKGGLEVYSELGQGTTFKVYLPAVQEIVQSEYSQSRLNALPRGNETVLVVEDEEIVRNVAIKTLRRQGYNILFAGSGPEALALLKDEPKKIDLLMTDIVMPNMNGKQLSEELHKVYPNLKTLFTSGYTENVIAHHGVLDEGVNFIGKPYTPNALAERIRAILDE